MNQVWQNDVQLMTAMSAAGRHKTHVINQVKYRSSSPRAIKDTAWRHLVASKQTPKVFHQIHRPVVRLTKTQSCYVDQQIFKYNASICGLNIEQLYIWTPYPDYLFRTISM